MARAKAAGEKQEKSSKVNVATGSKARKNEKAKKKTALAEAGMKNMRRF